MEIVEEVLTLPVKYIDVKFELTGRIYTFKTNIFDLKSDDIVVCENDFGSDLGVCVGHIKDECLKEDLKMVVRKATKEDIKAYENNKLEANEALEFCKKQTKMLGLDMRLIKAEYSLDKTKLSFIYTADDRVDFRELLKVLASNFHCRIELKQIGARDKAKIVKGIGPCGRELCCGKFVNEFDMVSINMAKNQLLALNIQKLSGHCGKLMCCLKYEDEAYKELRQGLPKLNAPVEFEGENFRVVSMNVIAKTCKLENKQNTLYITLDELLEKGIFKKPQKKEKVNEKTEELSK